MGILNKLFPKPAASQPLASNEKNSSVDHLCKAPDSLKKLESLRESIKDKCNTDFPFLDKVYSPSSRVPSIDFTEWIIHRIEEKDIYAVKLLMREIIRANPGIIIGIGSDAGVGVEWIDECVESVLSLNFNDCIEIHEKAIKELLAIFVILSKDGGGREFWILENVNLITSAICVYPFKVHQNSFGTLIEKANKFIKAMKKDNVPAWAEFKLYMENDVNIPMEDISENKIAQILKNLPVSSRFHFFDTIEYLLSYGKKVVSLYDSTLYKTRSFGLDIEKSAGSLFDSGLFDKNNDYSLTVNLLTKQEIISMCEQINISVKKSWNKSKMLDHIISSRNGQQLIDMIINNKRPCNLKDDYMGDLINLNNYKNRIGKICELLCFL